MSEMSRERLTAEPHGVVVASGGHGEGGGVLERVPSAERARHPLEAASQVSQLPRHAGEPAALEQAVDPPQPAPHLDPGPAQPGGGIQHLGGQPGALLSALGSTARQLSGAQRIDEHHRITRRPGHLERPPAGLSGPLILTAVDERLGMAG